MRAVKIGLILCVVVAIAAPALAWLTGRPFAGPFTLPVVAARLAFFPLLAAFLFLSFRRRSEEA